jgi:predicted lactoylglutathione lyase
MATQIFVNLPVKDLNKSMAFFKSIGYSFNPQFTDETAACLVISNEIYAMLLTHEKFMEFTTKEIVDATKSTEVLIALSTESKAEVNAMLDKVIKAGGKEFRQPMDYGFMFSRSFEDLDGHVWEILWMDPKSINQPAETAMANS